MSQPSAADAPHQNVSADRKDHRVEDPTAQRVWAEVSRWPVRNLWDFQGASAKLVFKRTGQAFLDDNLASRAAELGFYFLFALFPMLICTSSLLGLAAKHASDIYMHLLDYLALVVPPAAYQLVVATFNQTTAASTGGKLTLGLAAALWSASVGFSSIQDGMNVVYKAKETRPYWKARGSAILVTVLLGVLVMLNLAVLLLGDFCAHGVRHHVYHHWIAAPLVVLVHIVTWVVAMALLMLLFSTIYYYAPDLKAKTWRWITPGATIGIASWVVASIGWRVYLHFFNSYSVTYGSLGAVIILLMWFYITGLTLLLGAEVNSEIHAAVIEKHLKEEGEIPVTASAHP
jgi:membrane protein